MCGRAPGIMLIKLASVDKFGDAIVLLDHPVLKCIIGQFFLMEFLSFKSYNLPLHPGTSIFHLTALQTAVRVTPPISN